MKRRRYFQWIDGEQKGDVVILESIREFNGEVFYNFDDGESCNLEFISHITDDVFDLKNKFMVEIESPSNPWTFEYARPRIYSDKSMKEDVEIPPLNAIVHQDDGSNVVEKDKLVPPRKTQTRIPLPSPEDYPVVLPEDKSSSSDVLTFETPNIVEQTKTTDVLDVISPSTTIPQQPAEQIQAAPAVIDNVKHSSFDPVKILVDTCKKHETDVEFSVSLNLPAKSMYMIAESEFENGGDKFVNFIIDELDTKIIVDQLKLALKEIYSKTNTQE